MSVNFFVAACQEPSLTNPLFGICDDHDGQKAYTNADVANQVNWIATVKNDRNKELTFIAVDNCLIMNNEHPGRGRCDGLLISDEHLYFVELKDQDKHWRTKAIQQLESTIQFFIESHNINAYKHKKAFACNKQFPHFQEIDNELNLSFFRKYRVRIDVQAEIIVV
jgi:hypothetical protein